MSDQDIKFMTQWWFEHGRGPHGGCKAIWERELLPLMKPPIDSYLEIGVCEGHSMRWVLENLQPKLAVGIDCYLIKKRNSDAIQHKQNMLQNLKPWLDTGQCLIIEERSQDILRENNEVVNRYLLDDSFDLIYVDGSHEALPAITDMILAWPKLKVGGIMVMDDYWKRYTTGRAGGAPMSKEAIDAFLDAAESKYDWLWGPTRQIWNPQVGIRKIKP